jgi:hypothetical protein
MYGVLCQLRTGSWLDDWTYWHLPLKSLTTAHNKWLPKTRSIHYWTECLLFHLSSTVTNFILICESVTSTKNNLWIAKDKWQMKNELWMSVSPFHKFGAKQTQMTTSSSSSIIPCPSVAAETCVNFVATLWFPQAYPLLRKLAYRVLAQQQTSLRCFSNCTLPAFRRHVTLLSYSLLFLSFRYSSQYLSSSIFEAIFFFWD